MNRWSRPALLTLLFAMSLAGPSLLLHRQHLGPGQLPYLRDLSRTHLTYKRLTTTELRDGRLPAWNPAHTSGSPLFANPNFFHLHPISLLFLVFPFAAAFSWSLAGTSLLLAVGTGLWLRARGHSRVAAAGGAAALALGGFGASLTNLFNLLASYAAVPWCLWASERLVRQPNGRRTATLAVALAVAILGGEPTAWAWGLVLGITLAGLGRTRQSLGWLVLAAALSVALAAAQWLPLAELTGRSVRGAGFSLANATHQSIHPGRLVELVWPFPFGNPMTPWSGFEPGPYFDGGSPLLYSLFPGWMVLLLAVAGARSRTGDRWLLLGLAGLALLLAVGRHGPLYPALWSWLPPARSFRYPQKLILPVYFILALLVGRALDLPWLRRRKGLAALLVTLAVGELLLVHTRLVPAVASATLLDPPPMAAKLGHHRVYFWLEPDRYEPPAQTLEELHRTFHRQLIPPAGMAFAVDYVLDPDPDALDTVRMATFGRLLHRSPGDRARLLPLTAAELVVSPTPLHYGWLAAEPAPELHLYRLRQPLGYARQVDATAVRWVDGPEQAQTYLGDPAFDPRRTTVVEVPGSGRPSAPSAANSGARAFSGREPTVLRFPPGTLEVTFEGPGVLVLAQAFDPGWQARLDGQPTPVLPVNLAFSGVLANAPGPHRLRLDYRPWSIPLGAGLSGLGLLAVLALVARSGSGHPDSTHVQSDAESQSAEHHVQ